MITKRDFMSYRLDKDQDDDFEFGGGTGAETAKSEEDEEEVITGEEYEEEEDEEDSDDDDSEGSEKDDSEKEEDEEAEESDDDEESDDSSDTDDKKKTSGDKGEEDEEGDDDEETEFFDSLIKDEDETDKQVSEVDFSSFSEDLDLEFAEEENTKDRNTFVDKVKQKIQEAQQEFNLNEYPEHTRNLIQYIAKTDGGDAMKLFENPSIVKSQSIIGMDAEDKVAVVIENQLRSQGVKGEDLDARIEEELGKLSTREIKDAADKINENARNNIKTEIQKIAGDQEKIVEKSRQQQQQTLQQQKENFKKAVDQTDAFLGLKLTDKAKATIKRDLDAGIVEKTSDIKDPYIALNAYIIKKFGKDIEKHIQSKLAERSREGYNKASDKHKQRLHNTKGSAQGKQTGGHKDAQKEKGKARGWSLDEIE